MRFKCQKCNKVVEYIYGNQTPPIVCPKCGNVLDSGKEANENE